MGDHVSETTFVSCGILTPAGLEPASFHFQRWASAYFLASTGAYEEINEWEDKPSDHKELADRYFELSSMETPMSNDPRTRAMKALSKIPPDPEVACGRVRDVLEASADFTEATSPLAVNSIRTARDAADEVTSLWEELE